MSSLATASGLDEASLSTIDNRETYPSQAEIEIKITLFLDVAEQRPFLRQSTTKLR